jgi:hypothetical protein
MSSLQLRFERRRQERNFFTLPENWGSDFIILLHRQRPMRCLAEDNMATWFFLLTVK